ncbi:flagellar basal-body MS-ring/collar protein FliF [Planosporangium mesophilum]|uniref:Flagellar M-ring protein n=1 Tax=Planosporangium mesophilum TaxID=689768 RepID=A0A8J3TH41_9ACTN|nr:flagellar basal-body MS-ring/collar protein FliF [Planosporangium mesophilum]NJC86504.1 flagellar M-ring protein FliF [Planosporangium mesophilum]GII26169.1 flagellar M-ring protein [Planosporangium mesophilum]
MRDRVTAVLRRVVETFQSFTPGQRAISIFAVVALAVGGYFFSTWAAQPTYAPLFNNLAPADASAIVDKLNADGVPYQLTNGGQTITVPQDQVYAQRIKLSGAGLPAQADTGYALLDKQGVMTSDFMQQVGYQRALEGELNKTIKSIAGVQSAAVHLAIPTKDVFADNQQKPTASVLVQTGPSGKLSSPQAQAIVHLVSSSVPGLEPSKVTLVGADGKVLSTDDAAGASGAADARTQQTQAFEQRMGSSLQQMLDQVVGPGHAAVQVTADLDFDQTETKTQKYVADPNTPPLAETKKTETYTGNGTMGAGVLGPDNIQVPGGTGGANNGYNAQSETRNNAVGMVTETRKSAPGSVRKLSVAVMLDSATAKGANEAQLQQLVSSAVGLDAARGDTIALSTVPFDKSASDANAKALADAKKAEEQDRLYSLAKTGGIVAAILLLMFFAWLRSRRRNKRLRRLQAEIASANEERLQLELANARAALEAEGGETARLAITPGGGPNDEEAAAERELRQREISSLVEQQPDEVAQVLRGWLADRRS